LLVTDQPKEGAEYSDSGCRHIGYSSDLFKVRAASLVVDDEPEVLYGCEEEALPEAHAKPTFVDFIEYSL